MRRARRSTLTHWFVFAIALCFSWLLTPDARSNARPPQQSSSPSSSSASTSSPPAPAKKKTKSRRSKREPSQKAPTPQRISEIQSALARNGYYHGEPNGKWDANTIAAMQKFQSDNGIEPNGKLNAPSLQKLGLGSSTAGVSAPKPPAGPAPASTSPPPTPASPAPPPPAPSSTSSSTSVSSAAPKPSSPAPKPPQP